jgi:hypothetical protein
MNVGAFGASFDKTFTAALTGRENRQTGPAARWKCTPSAYGISPGGGDLLYAYHRDSYENIGRA